MRKQRPVCAHCGSDRVSADSYAEWDFDRQEWSITNTFDKGAYCEPCGGETTIEWTEEPSERYFVVSIPYADDPGSAIVCVAVTGPVSTDQIIELAIARLQPPDEGVDCYEPDGAVIVEVSGFTDQEQGDE